MTPEWTRHDDSTHYLNLGRALLVVVVHEKMGAPGWKVQVGKRSLKDKIPNLEDAKRVALAYEMAAIEGLDALSRPDGGDNSLRGQTAAASHHAFDIRRLTPIPENTEERIFHVLQLD